MENESREPENFLKNHESFDVLLKYKNWWYNIGETVSSGNSK